MEFELLKHEIEKVDELIRIGQENYNWNSPGEIMTNLTLYIKIFKCYINN